MITAEMKRQLIDKIQASDNNSLLEEVYRILEIDLVENDSVLLTNEQRESINQGLKDIETGNYKTHLDANSEIEEWLKK